MFDCLKKDPPARGYGEGSDTVYKVGFIIPHTTTAPGASSFDGQYNENNYARIFVPTLDLPFSLRDGQGVSGAAADLRSEGCNFSIEPHYNSYNSLVSGMELLVRYEDQESIEAAEKIIATFKAMYPDRTIRGIKKLKKRGRGRGNLDAAARKGMKVQILSELFFGDNPKDWMSPKDQADFWRAALKNI